MNFQVYDLKQQQRGATAVVTLTTGANVRLMDSTNYSAYKRGRQHRFHGGMAKVSPFRIPIPHAGHWYVTVDLAGLRATSVRSSVQVEPAALMPVRSAAAGSLSQIRRQEPPVLAVDPRAQVWDVFISHASEDKLEVARPLGAALIERGVTVWLDDELRIGDSLRRKIDTGLASSRFGIVVLSRSFFAKGWPQYELDGIVTRSVSGEQTLLPVWHDITKAEVMAQSPSLADKIARSTAQFTIQEIADEIAEVVSPQAHDAV